MTETENVVESTNGDRLQFLYLNLVGHVVNVHGVDGSITEGLFVSRTDDDAAVPAILLSKTRNRRSVVCNAEEITELSEMMLVPLSDVVFVSAAGVRVEAAAAGRVGHYRSTALEMNWADLPPEEEKGMSGNLEEEEREWVPGKWNQFETNEKKFGVKSSYKEEHYTTVLDKTKFTKEQHEQADRVARDIERSQTRGTQHRIERGEEVEGDEGTLYSDVQRTQAAPAATADGKRAPAASALTNVSSKPTATYVPPAKKAQLQGGAPTPLESSSAAPNASVPAASSRGGKDSATGPTSIEQQQQQQQQLQQQQQSNNAGASPNATSGGKGFNINAKAFVPGGAPAGGVAPAAQLQPPTPPTTPIVVGDMLAVIARAMESERALHAPQEWAGEDDDAYGVGAVQQQHGGGQYAAPGHIQQHHHLHHMQHHHHMHHLQHHQHHQHQHHHQHAGLQQGHQQHSTPLPGGASGGPGNQPAYSGGAPGQQQYGANGPSYGAYRPGPGHSPTTAQQVGPQQTMPPPQQQVGGARVPPPAQTVNGKSAQQAPQQPQQPVAAPAAASTGPLAAPVSVSEEPRRSMTGTSLGRGARASQNPTRHEDPAPSAPSHVQSNAQLPPGASLAAANKKKGSK